MPFFRAVGRSAIALLFVGVFGGCASNDARRYALERCEAGMKRALGMRTRPSALRIYREECADLYNEPACRSALRGAVGGERGAELLEPLTICSRAYCASSTDSHPEVCHLPPRP